jgi:hypothetical protein
VVGGCRSGARVGSYLSSAEVGVDSPRVGSYLNGLGMCTCRSGARVGTYLIGSGIGGCRNGAGVGIYLSGSGVFGCYSGARASTVAILTVQGSPGAGVVLGRVATWVVQGWVPEWCSCG